ncbi:hypothetical protein RUND412_010898, partial [Rhizina undulata]
MEIAGPSSPSNIPLVLVVCVPPIIPTIEAPVIEVKNTIPATASKYSHDCVKRMPAVLQEGEDVKGMVSIVLSQPVDGVTVKEVISLLPDILHSFFDVKRIPPIPPRVPSPQQTLVPNVPSSSGVFKSLTRLQAANYLENLYV